MRKCLSRLLPVLFSILFSYTGFAQQIDSMMGVYADRSATEKIHIHFDKTIYNKGETVWYKVYILQGNSSDTAVASMNVYLDWYDADGKLITHTSAPVLFSTSQGSFDIPADYKGESLQVKAFTRWMLNDDPAFSYHRELAVNTNTPKTTKPPPNKTSVAIFPESGFLIQGLNTRVAFKATNQYGHPVFIKGILVDNTNHPIDSLRVQHDGMGSFYFIPLLGQTYQLNWIDEYGVTGSTPVPVTKTEGAHITLKTTRDKVKLQVTCTENVPENFKEMVLVVHMNRVGLYRVEINTSEKTIVNSEVPIDDLPTGLLQFTLFTSDWIPVAERVIFINNRSHKFDVKFTAPLINLDKRGKNTFEISVPDTLFTNMSISITDAAVSPPDHHSIFSDILLSSEIKGKVYNPAYYLSSDADSVASHLDLVMLTNAWRRFDWDKIRAHIPPKINYPVENGYMKLNGKVLGMKKNSEPVQLNLVVVNKDSSRQFIAVPVEKDGSFQYPTVFFDTAKLFYSFNNNKSMTEKAELKIDNGLFQLPPKNIQPAGSYAYIRNTDWAKQNLDALLAEQELLRKKMAETTLKEVIVTGKIKSKLELINEKYSSGFFRGNPARRSYMYDLTKPERPITAQNALHYLQSRIPGLTVRCASMLDCRAAWRGAKGPIEFYLNEMPATLDMILNMPVEDIALIKAFPPPFFYSSDGMINGAIAIYTKRMEDYKQPEIKGLPNLVLAGYSKFKEFYSPSYEEPDENSTKPDNRTTIYWNPNLITNQAQQRIRIDFFNSDFTKSFNMVLEGINSDGKMTRVVRTIDAQTKVD
jgi:hypothetical protein